MRQPADVLVRGGVVVTMDPGRRLINDGAVAVQGNRIVAVGKYADLQQAYAPRKELGDGTSLVFPGLIDAHNHPVHFLSKGMIDDMPIPERWRERVWPYESSLTPEETEVAAQGTFMEMIRRGTTCFSDPGGFFPHAVASAMQRVGMRGVLSRITWDVFDPAAPAQYNDTADSAMQKAESVVRELHGADDGRIRAGFSLVRASHVSPELVRAVSAQAKALGVGIHAHLSTTQAEFAMALEKWGTTPVERYRDLGVLSSNIQLVHMGALSQEDVQTLKEFDVTVCHCPSASMFGGFGCITHGRFPELVEQGVRVVLGTDACAVSRFLDMVRVMYLAACAHKDVKADPTVIGAHKAMEMATIDGAAGLLWDDEIGSLEVGKKADLVIADTSGIEWQPNPLANPVANLIYSSDGGCVRSVLIDGRVVLEDKQFTEVDEAAFAQRASAVSSALLGRLGFKLRTQWPAH